IDTRQDVNHPARLPQQLQLMRRQVVMPGDLAPQPAPGSIEALRRGYPGHSLIVTGSPGFFPKSCRAGTKRDCGVTLGAYRKNWDIFPAWFSVARVGRDSR